MEPPRPDVDAIAELTALAAIERALLPFAAWLDANPGRDVAEYDGWRDPPDTKAIAAGSK